MIVKTRSIALSDMDLGEATETIDENIKAAIMDAESQHPDHCVASMQVVPLVLPYTVHGETISERDYHFTDRGIVLVLTLMPKIPTGLG